MENIKKEVLSFLRDLILALMVVFVIHLFITLTLVEGQSMYPTLNDNNYLIISKADYFTNEPNRGDIIVFKSPLEDSNGKNKNLVKRVIAVSGDSIKITNGEVYLNGEKLVEDYIDGDTDGEIDTVIPEGYVFVMGDNRANSLDSRSDKVGLVSTKNDVIGKIRLRLFPFNEIGIF